MKLKFLLIVLMIDASSNLWIAYHDLGDQSCWVMHREESGWVYERLDAVGGVGDLRTDPRGQPSIAYRSQTLLGNAAIWLARR